MPMKSSPGVWFMGPTYHHSVYRASKSLLDPLQTHTASAQVGTNSAPASQAEKPGQLPPVSKRIPYPPPGKIATTTPATQTAGSGRSRVFAHENSSFGFA